jgi:hypothetical protein
VIQSIDVIEHRGLMHEVLARYELPAETLCIVPELEVPAKVAWGKIYVRETIDPERSLPIFPLTDAERARFLSSPPLLVECLLLHEIFHLRNHTRDVSELTVVERLANEEEADEWALQEMGFKVG